MAAQPGPVQVSDWFVRPGDTTAYAVGDVVSNNATATQLLKFPGCGFAAGGSGLIVGANLETDNSSETASYTLVLYNAPAGPATGPYVQVAADNAAATVVYRNFPMDQGSLTFPAVAAGTGTSTGAKAQWSPSAPLPFTCGATDNALYGVLITNTATTPNANQRFTVRLSILQTS